MWLVAVVLSWIINSNEQYMVSRAVLLVFFLLHIVLGVVLQFQSLKGRRNWQSSVQNSKFKVYHYDIEHNIAEWIQTSPTDLRPGSIYKIPMGCKSVPADSILLHCNKRIIQVDESPIIEYLSPLENQEKVTLKETVIRKEGIVLPLTGVVHYELQAPEIRSENISGRMMLQEPSKANY